MLKVVARKKALFIRRKGKSFYVCENRRVNGKVRQKALACLGECPDIDSVIAERKKHLERYERMAARAATHRYRAVSISSMKMERLAYEIWNGDAHELLRSYLSEKVRGPQGYDWRNEYRKRERERTRKCAVERWQKLAAREAARIAKLETLRDVVSKLTPNVAQTQALQEWNDRQRRSAEAFQKLVAMVHPKPKDWAPEYRRVLTARHLGKRVETDLPEGLAFQFRLGKVSA